MRFALVVCLLAGCGFHGNAATDGGGSDDDAPNPQTITVGFASEASTTDESSTTYAVPVLLSAPTDHPVTVNYAVLSGGSATQPTDYSLEDGQLAIATGTTQANISVTITGAPHDDVAFTIALSAPQGAQLGGHPQHTVTIAGHALPTVSFNPASKMLSESVLSPSPQIALSAAATTPVTVTYRVVSPPSGAVAATSGTDFMLVDGTVTISAGELSAPLPLTVVNDPTDEYDEELDVSIISVLNAKPAATNQLLAYTILDDDPPPTVSFPAPTGSLPENAMATSIPVTLSAASGKDITVPYHVTLGTASTADIAIADGTLTFTAGTTTATIPVNVIQDAIDEDDETFSIALDIAGATNVTAGANLTLDAKIIDDDLPPTVAITTLDKMIPEAGGAQQLDVALSGPSAKPITVAFVNGGTAVRNTDFSYVPSNQSLTFAPGTIAASITIQAIDNTLDDMNRTVITTLVNPVNATVVTGNQQTTTIVDDEPTCYGTLAYRVCVALPPTTPVPLPATLDTDSSTLCGAQPVGWAAQNQPAVCLVAGSTVTGSGTVITGSRPLIILAADTLTLTGTLDAASHQMTGTAGPGAQMTCATGTAMGAAAGGGGGAGGSYSSSGGAGGAGDNGNQGGALAGALNTPPSSLIGGCPGGFGASASTTQNAGPPGDGGGAIYLVAGNKIAIDNATLDASGGGATGGGHKAGGSGGGSGGQIRLLAPAITATGAKIFAVGGGGASGGDGGNGVAGGDPASPGTNPAQGGMVANGGRGGNGFAATSTQATAGANGKSNTGGGGGGGGGGAVISNKPLTGAAIAAGFQDIGL